MKPLINYGYSKKDGNWWVDAPDEKVRFTDGRRAYAFAKKHGIPYCLSRKRNRSDVPLAAPDEEEIALAKTLQASLKREESEVQESMDAVRTALREATVHYAEERGLRTFEVGISRIPVKWGAELGAIAARIETCLPDKHYLGSIRFGSDHPTLYKSCTVSFTVHCPWAKGAK